MGATLYLVSMHLSWNLKSNSCQLTELRSVFLVFASFHGEVCPVSSVQCSVPEAAPSHHLATTRALREDRALWLSHFKIKSSSQTNPRPSEGVVNKTVESYSFYTYICNMSIIKSEGNFSILRVFYELLPVWWASFHTWPALYKQNPWLWLVVGSRTPQGRHPKSDLFSRISYKYWVGFRFFLRWHYKWKREKNIPYAFVFFLQKD